MNMYDRLKMFYEQGLLTNEQLHKAVDRDWITEEQYQVIINSVD